MTVFPNVPIQLQNLSAHGMGFSVGSFKTGEVDVFTSYSETWQNLYSKKNWFGADPAIAASMRGPGLHSWHATESGDPDFIDACRDFRLDSGLVVTDEISGSTCVTGLTTNKEVSEAERREIIRCTRIAHLDHLKNRALSLSQDQKDLVYLFANGHRAKEVAAIYNLSEDGIKQRKLTIQRTIGVNNFLVVVNICAQAGITLHPIN